MPEDIRRVQEFVWVAEDGARDVQPEDRYHVAREVWENRKAG